MLDDEKSLLARADSYFEKGNPEKALACYRLILRVNRNEAVLQVLYPKIARTYAALKKYEEAIDACLMAEKYAQPDKLADILVEIGRLHQSDGNHREAVDYYRKALQELHPPDYVGDVHYWLGESLYKVSDLDANDESLEILEQAKSEERGLVLTWEIYNTRGHALTQKKRYEEALGEFELALGEHFDLIDIPGNIYNNKAGCLEELGREEDAISCYEDAIRAPRGQRDTIGFARIKIGTLLKDSKPNLARIHLEEAKVLFEAARDTREIPEWFAREHLDNICGLIADIEDDIGSAPRYDVFLSHSSRDEEEARKLYDRLKSKGFSVYSAKKALSGGDSFTEEIRGALQASSELWIIITRRSLKSNWVTAEWAAGWALEKRLVPILLGCEPEELPDQLRALHCRGLHQIDDLIQELKERVGVSHRL
ncbi:MAG: TIR domain-containing protein [bacterium]|nr:TIR domain-containing protein [bacterium]